MPRWARIITSERTLLRRNWKALRELEKVLTNYQSAEAAAALLIVRGNASQEKSQSVSPSGYVSSAYRRTINLLAWLLACPDVGDMYSEAGGCAAGAVCSGRHLKSTHGGSGNRLKKGNASPKYQHRFPDSAGEKSIVFPTAHQASKK